MATSALLGAVLVTIGAVAGAVPEGIGSPVAAPVALAASPAPSADTGDTRSAGEGPGLVGAPLLAIAGVIGVALAAGGVTLLYVRLTPPRPGASAAAETAAREAGRSARSGPGPARPR